MTPEHGYILLAIGAALFASLLVAWLWGRRKCKAVEPDILSVPPWLMRRMSHEPITQEEREVSGVAHLLPSTPSTHDSSTTYYSRAEPLYITGKPKPAPYASIAGTGSRPEAPWVTRELFDEFRRELHEYHKGAELEYQCDRDRYCARHDEAEARLARLEAGGEGDGWRAFRDGERWTWVFADGVLWSNLASYRSWNVVRGYDADALIEESREQEFPDFIELHGPERDEIVRAFREWKESQ